ncbi:MAG: hypothetical protein GXP62_04865 [Oligoflexia bacterium]|nr:hypothetical protein [Oligoflexia bacterium]
MRRASTSLFLFLLFALTWAGAAWLRLRALDQVAIGSDSLGPYLQALALSQKNLQAGFLPRPPNPESGDFLWVMALPAVHLAHSLRELFELRFIQSALIAPLGALGAWVWAAPDQVRDVFGKPVWQQFVAAVCAGTVLAVDPGLADTLVAGARGYGAPEVLALLTLALGLAWRGSGFWAAVAAGAFVVALDQHPLSFGLVLGLLMVLPGLGARIGLVDLSTACLVAFLFALPRLLRLLLLANCGEDPLTCLSEVALSNVHDDVLFQQVLLTALHDRFIVDLGPFISVGLVVGLLMSRPWTGIGTLALGGLAGVLLLASVTGYLQSYHLRILAAPLVVSASVGLARLLPLALIWAGWTAWVGIPKLPVGPDPGAVDRHDELALRLADEPAPIWVDRVWWQGPPALDASAVVLSAVLQGQDPDRFQVGADVPMVLLSTGSKLLPPGRLLAAGTLSSTGTSWSMTRVEDADQVKRWIARQGAEPLQTGGAWDWLTALHPEAASLEATRW